MPRADHREYGIGEGPWSKLIIWLGEEDSNPHKQVQSLLSYR